MTPVLAVLTLSDSFSELWSKLAASCGATLRLAASAEELTRCSGAAVVLIAAGGREKESISALSSLLRIDLPRIAVVGAETEYRLAVSILRSGADNYFALPADLGVMRAWLSEQLDTAVGDSRAVLLAAEGRARYDFSRMVGSSSPLLDSLRRASRVIPRGSATVLLTGETGTGKELLAKAIHYNGPRATKPLIEINCSALPENLLEAELFGYEAGAFTDARTAKPGLVEAAHGGTIFLDEIGDLSMQLQGKLLRVLEEQQFRRLGGETEIEVDVRVIAATNQPLRQLVEVGRFRRDLYFRLNVLHIDLPPLRERRADIPLLVEAFIREASREHDRPRITVSPEAMAILTGYDWPGNVRELRNLVESMVVLAPGQVIRPEDIPPEIRDARGRSRLLPVPIVRQEASGDSSAAPPELEFIFHTLVQLRMDVEDLRRQFDDYRATHPEVQSAYSGLLPAPIQPSRMHIVDVEPEPTEEDLAAEHDVVVFRPGMTLADLEKNAITAALREVAGNRRKAAEMLGMGERTLYRKIKEYDL